MKPHALISVYDKTNIIQIASVLHHKGYNIISTAGTGNKLRRNNIPFIPTEQATSNPDILKDCIQTISFNVSAGILFDRHNQEHKLHVKSLGIKPIDVVICNFPPLTQTVRSLSNFNILNVDVGGPLMIRAAATNYKDVLVVVGITDYDGVIDALKYDLIDENFKKNMAIKAYEYSSLYDSKLAKFLKYYDHRESFYPKYSK